MPEAGAYLKSNPLSVLKRLITLLVLSLCMLTAYGQLNETDTAKFQLRASITGNYQKGNVEVFSLRSKLDITYTPVKNFVLKSQNNSLYQAFYDTKADNDIFSRNYIYYKPQHRLYPFAIGYISANYRRKIDLRYFAGAGATVQLIRRPKHIIKISASAVYEQTNFNGSLYNFTAYNNSNRITVWRATAYIAGWHYFFEKYLRLYYDAFWQPAFADGDNYRTQFDIGADLPVWKGLSFNLLYTYTHENIVIQKVRPDDRILTCGLAYNLRTMNR